MWNLKYYSDWIDDKGNSNRVEILTEQSTTSQEVRLTGFSIQYPEFDLFSDKAVYGAGANLTIVSEGALDYMDELYTIDPKGLQLRHYVNSSLNFTGYIDTEQYSDDFFNPVNYDFSISANNGIAVLDRIKISDDSGNELSGIYNALDVIKFALNKLDISYDNLYTGISTDIDNGLPTLIVSKTILHKLNVKAANYVDEKGNWMSCREVINAILLPLTLKMVIVGDDVYIVDINKLARADNLTLKQYSFSDLIYVQDITDSNVFDIDKVVNGNVLTKQSGMSKVNVKFNKYVDDDIDVDIDETTVNNMINSEFIEDFEYKYYEDNNKFTLYEPPTDLPELMQIKPYFVEKINTKDSTDKEFYLRFFHYNNSYQAPLTTSDDYSFSKNNIFTLTPNLDTISSRKYLKIEGKIMIEDTNKPSEQTIINNSGHDVYLFIKPQVDNYEFYEGRWTDADIDDKYLYYMLTGYIDSNDASYQKNTWIDFNDLRKNLSTEDRGIIIPLNSDEYSTTNTDFTKSIEGGELKLHFAIHRNTDDFNYAIKDLSIKIVEKDEYGNYIEADYNSDDEYKGSINDYYINDLSIETKHGTDEEVVGKGILMLNLSGNYDDSDYATNQRYVQLLSLKRENNTGTCEELLLNTYLSNLQLSRYKYNTTLLSYHSILDRFKYKLYRDGIQCRLIPVGMTCDYLRGESTVNLLEIVKDE